MAFAIVLLVLACSMLAALLTFTSRPFEVGAFVLALSCGVTAALLSHDAFLSVSVGAGPACGLLTLRTIIETFAVLDRARKPAVRPRRLPRHNRPVSEDDQSTLAA